MGIQTSGLRALDVVDYVQANLYTDYSLTSF